MATTWHSSHEMLGFVAEIQNRISKVLGKMAQLNGGELRMDAQQEAQLKNARRLHQRFAKGDFRHNDHEAGSLVELANWLVVQHAKNEGQEPTTFDINPDLFIAESESTKPGPDSYSEAAFKVMTGWPGEG